MFVRSDPRIGEVDCREEMAPRKSSNLTACWEAAEHTREESSVILIRTSLHNGDANSVWPEEPVVREEQAGMPREKAVEGRMSFFIGRGNPTLLLRPCAVVVTGADERSAGV